MTYNQIERYYGGAAKVARVLKISRQAVNKWKKAGVPMLRQYELERITDGDLRAAGRGRR